MRERKRNMKKKTFLRCLATILAVLTVFCSVSTMAYASDPTYDFETIRDYLVTELAKCSEEIDLKSFHIPYSDELKDKLFDYIKFDLAEAFHTRMNKGDVVTFGKTDGNKEFASISIKYYYTASEYATMREKFDKEVEYALRGLKGSSIPDAEKALIIHDRIAVTCEYDDDLAAKANANKLDEADTDGYSAYGCLVKGKAVCEGYSKSFNYLMRQLGIKARTVPSTKLVHAWNIVEIGGKTYNVDVTYDDPTNGTSAQDIYGNVIHDFFMCSTEKYNNLKHNNVKNSSGQLTSEIASDFEKTEAKDYDNAYWENSITEAEAAGSTTYYVDYSKGKLCSRSGGTSKEVLTIDYPKRLEYTLPITGKKYTFFSRLGSDNSRIFFSTDTKIYRFDPDTGKTAVVATPDLGSNKIIFGFRIRHDELQLTLFEFETNKITRVTASYKPDAPVDDGGSGDNGGNGGNSDTSEDAIIQNALKEANAKLIAGNPSSRKKEYGYKTNVTFTVNVPEGSTAEWFVKDTTDTEYKTAGKGATCTPRKDATKSYIIKVVITDGMGNKQIDTEVVTIRTGFFQMLIAFFKGLFGSLDVTQS